VRPAGGKKEDNKELLDSTQPLLDGCLYLDDELLDTLREQAGIVPYAILQKLGDAILVPAGCAHQVRNLRSCIKIAADFVAPEHVQHCVRLTEELRQLPSWHHRRQDVLSVRTILLYAALACFRALDENRRKEEVRKERQRRLDRKGTLSSEPPQGATTSAGAPPPVPPAPNDALAGSTEPGAVSLSMSESALFATSVANALHLDL